MLYPYITLADETEISHSHLLDDHTVEVHFERATERGFDSARCVLPDYRWKYREGYTEEEMTFFEEFLRNNAHLLFKYAQNGGVNCA